MPRILNNPIIISGGGGAALNIEYSSYTPPTGTNKIWVKSDLSSQVDIKPYHNEASVGQAENLDNYADNFIGFNPHASCTLSDGRIALTNGRSLRIYNPSNQTWGAKINCTGDVPYSIYYIIQQLAVVNDVIYFLATSSSSTSITVYLYRMSLAGYVTRLVMCPYYSYGVINTLVKHDSANNRLICWVKGENGSTAYFDRLNYNLSSSTIENSNQITIESNDTNAVARTFGFVIGGEDLYMCFKGTSRLHLVQKISYADMTYSWVTEFDSLIESGRAIFHSQGIEKDNFIYFIGGTYAPTGAIDSKMYPSRVVYKYNYTTNEAERIDDVLISDGLMNNPSGASGVDNGGALCVNEINGRIYMINGYQFTYNSSTYGRKNVIDYFDVSYPLANGKLLITTANAKKENNVPLIVSDNTNINVLVENAMRGNSEGVAEKVNIYKYDETSSTWKGLNCSDWEW